MENRLMHNIQQRPNNVRHAPPVRQPRQNRYSYFLISVVVGISAIMAGIRYNVKDLFLANKYDDLFSSNKQTHPEINNQRSDDSALGIQEQKFSQEQIINKPIIENINLEDIKDSGHIQNKPSYDSNEFRDIIKNGNFKDIKEFISHLDFNSISYLYNFLPIAGEESHFYAFKQLLLNFNYEPEEHTSYTKDIYNIHFMSFFKALELSIKNGSSEFVEKVLFTLVESGQIRLGNFNVPFKELVQYSSNFLRELVQLPLRNTRILDDFFFKYNFKEQSSLLDKKQKNRLLDIAIRNNDKELVELILISGAADDEIEHDSSSFLSNVILENNFEIASILIEHFGHEHIARYSFPILESPLVLSMIPAIENESFDIFLLLLEKVKRHKNYWEGYHHYKYFDNGYTAFYVKGLKDYLIDISKAGHINIFRYMLNKSSLSLTELNDLSENFSFSDDAKYLIEQEKYMKFTLIINSLYNVFEEGGEEALFLFLDQLSLIYETLHVYETLHELTDASFLKVSENISFRSYLQQNIFSSLNILNYGSHNPDSYKLNITSFVELGYIKTIRVISEFNKDLFKQCDDNGFNAMTKAVSLGNLDIFRAIVQKYPILAIENDDNGHNAITLATVNERMDIIRYIGERSLTLFKEYDSKGRNMMVVAAENGKTEIIRLIAQFNEKLLLENDKNKFNALTSAIKCGNYNIIKIISEINLGFLKVTDKYGNNAMTRSIDIGSPKIIRFFHEIDKNLLSLVDDNGLTPILKATKLGKLEFVKEFAKLDKRLLFTADSKNKTVISYAFEYSNLDILRFISDIDRDAFLMELDASYLAKKLVKSFSNQDLSIPEFLVEIDKDLIFKFLQDMDLFKILSQSFYDDFTSANFLLKADSEKLKEFFRTELGNKFILLISNTPSFESSIRFILDTDINLMYILIQLLSLNHFAPGEFSELRNLITIIDKHKITIPSQHHDYDITAIDIASEFGQLSIIKEKLLTDPAILFQRNKPIIRIFENKHLHVTNYILEHYPDVYTKYARYVGDSVNPIYLSLRYAENQNEPRFLEQMIHKRPDLIFNLLYDDGENSARLIKDQGFINAFNVILQNNLTMASEIIFDDFKISDVSFIAAINRAYTFTFMWIILFFPLSYLLINPITNLYNRLDRRYQQYKNNLVYKENLIRHKNAKVIQKRYFQKYLLSKLKSQTDGITLDPIKLKRYIYYFYKYSTDLDKQELIFQLYKNLNHDVDGFFDCSITFDRMNHPVIALPGLHYDKAALDEWNKNRYRKNPFTGELGITTYFRDHAFKKIINEFDIKGEVERSLNDIIKKVDQSESS